MKKIFFLLIGCVAVLISQAQNSQPVVYYNAVINADSHRAFAVKDGVFIAVGHDTDILNAHRFSEKIDLQGKAVYPGFIDAHCHFYGYGLGLLQLDVTGTQSWEDIIRRLQQFAVSHPEGWLIGRGWDQNDWAVKTYPDNTRLNQLFPNRPVVLKRIDGHAVIANQKALELAGITADTKVEGGEILKKNGKLSGILIDNAVDILDKVIPRPDREQVAEALLSAEKKCFAAGLTTVDDAGLDLDIVKQIDSLQRAGILKMNVYAMLNPAEECFAFAKQNGIYRTPRLTVRSFKLYVDGALGSRGALLKQVYCDQKEHFGLQLKPQAYFDSLCKRIYDLGYQACSHAIGDSANSIILKAYQPYKYRPSDNENKTSGAYSSGIGTNWRIEHAQVIDPADFYKMAGIIPSVQPTHATSDMYWASKRLCSSRMKGAYAYKTILETTMEIALGTDFPVEDISPVKTFYAAVFRRDNKGYPPNRFQPQDALTRTEALNGMTVWAANANFENDRKGRIAPGMQADFVVLDNDLLTAEESEILKTKVLMTVVHGETVYSKQP